MSKKLPPNQRYTLNKEYRKLGWALNNALNEFSNMGVTTNQTRLLEQTLERFYESNNLSVANPQRVTLQKFMTEEQVNELADIVMSFAEAPQGLVFEEYENKIQSIDEVIADAKLIGGEEEFNVDRFKVFQDEFGVKNYQQYIDVIDALNNRKIDALLNDIISSDQIAEIVSYGHVKGYTNQELETMIITNYNDSGLTHERLYEQILNQIV